MLLREVLKTKYTFQIRNTLLVTPCHRRIYVGRLRVIISLWEILRVHSHVIAASCPSIATHHAQDSMSLFFEMEVHILCKLQNWRFTEIRCATAILSANAPPPRQRAPPARAWPPPRARTRASRTGCASRTPRRSTLTASPARQLVHSLLMWRMPTHKTVQMGCLDLIYIFRNQVVQWTDPSQYNMEQSIILTQNGRYVTLCTLTMTATDMAPVQVIIT